jgi:hypothetical protein
MGSSVLVKVVYKSNQCRRCALTASKSFRSHVVQHILSCWQVSTTWDCLFWNEANHMCYSMGANTEG